MPSKVSSILRKITRDPSSLNIFGGICHERFENNWKFFNHNFYAWEGRENLRTWNHKVSETPANYHIVPFGSIPQQVELDLCISHSPDVHYPIARQVSENLSIPLVCIWHTFPTPNYPKSQLRKIYQIFSRYINVFITEENKRAWGFTSHDRSFVIKHAVDSGFWTNGTQERQQVLLTVANDYINRDHLLGFDLYAKTVGLRTDQQLPVRPVGDTPGLSRGANSPEELRDIYQQSLIFLNTSLVSPLPMSLLEAMSCGCAVVSTNTGMIPSVIEHGINGILCPPDPRIMRQHCVQLLQDPELCRKLGDNARQTIIEKFAVADFVNSWEKIFRMAIE